MHKTASLFVVAVLIAQPAFAADPPSKGERDRQISEIVFQNYPPRALAAGEEGPVFFTVTLDKHAHPTSCQVMHGSGYPLLDAETCDLIVQHAVFNSARDADGRLVRQTTEGVVNWTIPGHAPKPINFSSAAAAAPKTTEPQVCKETLRMGTLSSYERTCMTPREWATQSDEQKQPYDEMQGRKGSTNCNIPIGGAGTEGVGAAPAPPAGSGC